MSFEPLPPGPPDEAPVPPLDFLLPPELAALAPEGGGRPSVEVVRAWLLESPSNQEKFSNFLESVPLSPEQLAVPGLREARLHSMVLRRVQWTTIQVNAGVQELAEGLARDHDAGAATERLAQLDAALAEAIDRLLEIGEPMRTKHLTPLLALRDGLEEVRLDLLPLIERK